MWVFERENTVFGDEFGAVRHKVVDKWWDVGFDSSFIKCVRNR